MATGIGASRINLAALLGKSGYKTELGKLQRSDAARRASATTILDPNDVSGDYDAARLLKTTLGGEIRPITVDDLKQFSYNARRLGKRFKGGITAQGVIDSSRQEDRDRSNAQIKTAVIVRAQSGTLHFLTNAGPESDVTRHHVNVEFPSFKSVAASPSDAKKLARPLLDGPLRFECDCGRFTFWYRYIATKGNFQAGRAEVGYPKIRNPKLTGVACKHALRVMQAIVRDAAVRAKVTTMIAAAQKNDHGAIVTKAAEARAQAQKHVEQGHHVRNRVETKADRIARQASTPAGKARAILAATREAERRAKAEQAQGRKALEEAFAKLQRAAPMTKAMRDALLAKLQAVKTID
jgi:hypothetical protein